MSANKRWTTVRKSVVEPGRMITTAGGLQVWCANENATPAPALYSVVVGALEADMRNSTQCVREAEELVAVTKPSGNAPPGIGQSAENIEPQSWFMISSKSPIRVTWDLMIFVILLYVSIAVPCA